MSAKLYNPLLLAFAIYFLSFVTQVSRKKSTNIVIERKNRIKNIRMLKNFTILQFFKEKVFSSIRRKLSHHSLRVKSAPNKKI